ncbi:hypothetical protein DFQ26_000557 [Actinomortierella ambigua]|nr:hypothetical protein DFQ26_000557 [Actinomortierella ambigua]
MAIMGRPRYNPFGLFQSTFQRLHTHRKLKGDYAVLMSEPGKAATPTIWDVIARRRSRQDPDEPFLLPGQKRGSRSSVVRESEGFSTTGGGGGNRKNIISNKRGSETSLLAAQHGSGGDRFRRQPVDQADSEHAMELMSPETATTAGGYGDSRSYDHPLQSPSSNVSGSSLDRETLRGSIMSQTPKDFRDMETMLLLQRERIAELEAQHEQTEQKVDDLIGVLREYYVDMMMFEPYDADSIKTSIQRSFTRGAGPIKRSLGLGQNVAQQQQHQQQQQQQQPQQQQPHRPHLGRRSYLRQTSQGSRGVDDTDEASVGLTVATSYDQTVASNVPGSRQPPFPPYASQSFSVPSWETPGYGTTMTNQPRPNHSTSVTAQAPPFMAGQPPPPLSGAPSGADPAFNSSQPRPLQNQNPFMTQSEREIPLRPIIQPDTFP